MEMAPSWPVAPCSPELPSVAQKPRENGNDSNNNNNQPAISICVQNFSQSKQLLTSELNTQGR